MADLEQADLEQADLEGANLSEANLKGAKMRGANLRGVKNRTTDQVLEADNWKEAIYDPTFAEELGLDKDDQIRRANEWDKRHRGDGWLL